MRRKGVVRHKKISKRIKTGNKKTLTSKKKNHVPNTSLWDKNMKIAENFKNIGIMTNINKEIDRSLEKNHSKINIEEEINVEDLNKGKIQLEQITYAPKKIKLTPDEKICIELLIKKHHDNFDKMFKDLKLNKFQWSVNQIQKYYEKYQFLYSGNNSGC